MMQVLSTLPRPIRVPLRLLLCVLLMPIFSTSLFAAPKSAAFPRLSDDVAASERLEIRRQIRGEIQAMFALPARGEVLVAAGGYLWRFSADGRLLDTLNAPGGMHRNGIAFDEDGFVDWVHTGERTRKAYAPSIDGNALSPAQLRATLATARATAFGKQGERAWAWLWDGATARRMDISRHRDLVDTYCAPRSSTTRTVAWSDTCLTGMDAPAPLLVEIRPDALEADAGGVPRVEVAGFDRRRYHLEGGAAGYVAETVVGGAIKAIAPHLPGGLPERYWFGDAHVRLRLAGDTLQFKLFVSRHDDGYAFEHMADWWDPGAVIPGASPWLRVRMREYMDAPGEETLWHMYGPDIGLYAVRPRGGGPANAQAERAVPAWRPEFEGPVTPRDAVTGTVTLEGGARVHRWWRARPPTMRIVAPTMALDAADAPLTALPRAMQVEWGSPWKAETHAVLEVVLDPAQTRAAFSRLPRAEQPAVLALQVPDLFGNADGMRVSLRQGSTAVVLDQARLRYLQRPPFRPWRPQPGQPTPPSRITQLQQTAEAVPGGGEDVLARFRAQAEALARDEDMRAQAAPFLAAAYAGAINQLNAAGRADHTLLLAQHFLDRVHPRIAAHDRDPSTAYNISVIVSQTLAVAAHRPQAAALAADSVALLGPDFDPDTHPNATLLYNLACYHALRGDRTRTLQHVAAALRRGKPAAQFRSDPDFAAFRGDPAFEAALQGRAMR